MATHATTWPVTKLHLIYQNCKTYIAFRAIKKDKFNLWMAVYLYCTIINFDLFLLKEHVPGEDDTSTTGPVVSYVHARKAFVKKISLLMCVCVHL